MTNYEVKDKEGNPKMLNVDQYLLNNLLTAIKRVKEQDHMYLGLVAGLPGAGKSTFTKNAAKICDANFTADHICFTDDEFIEKTNSFPDNSAIILDECFESLNTKISMSSKFQRILNHLQLIRQKRHFIFLILPNFFDLSKNVAIFLANHLFVIYEKNGQRGYFLAFDREKKRELYVKGLKFQNYNAVKANFHGRFYKYDDLIDEEAYLAKKKAHLLAQSSKIASRVWQKASRDDIIIKLHEEDKWKTMKIAEYFNISQHQVEKIIKKARDEAQKV